MNKEPLFLKMETISMEMYKQLQKSLQETPIGVL